MKKLQTLLSEEQIRDRIAELAEQITTDYKGKQPVLVAVLKGSFLFFSDLIRKIDLPLEVDFLGASSYGNKTVSSGVVRITLDLSYPISGRDVILVEDIVDTGNTLHYILEGLRLRNPASLKVCTLLLKPECIQKKVPVSYIGFKIPNKFVVGFGLDAAEKYRNLPYIAILPGEHE
ncbi:MAG: hypoxanthine phosphoribosyltransferase [Pseudomonadota bacterium]